MNRFIIILTKFINFILTKVLKKNGGNLPGKIAKKLNKNFIKYFNIKGKVITVTATNGKTTTNNCIKFMLEQNGKKVVSNADGNNMETGIISELIKHSKINGDVDCDYLTLEVDESYVPIIFKKIKLDTLVILDFFRDQLDRNGEVETLILKINDFLKIYDGNLILNADDPNVARLGKANINNKNVKYFSVDRYEFATDEEKEAGEGKFCPFDKERLKYDYYQYSHVGKFECPKCGFGKEDLFVELRNVNVKTGEFDVLVNKKELTHLKTTANSIYSVYNYAAVIAVAKLYSLDPRKALKEFKLNNGRCEEIDVKGSKTIINLAKNPTGANVSLRMLNEDDDEKELLFVLNDNIADGFDVSWIWDINFDVKKVTRIITSGKRAYDMAIRIKTSFYPSENIESYINLEDAVNSLYKTKTKKYVIANYTALQPTRKTILSLYEKCKQ